MPAVYLSKWTIKTSKRNPYLQVSFYIYDFKNWTNFYKSLFPLRGIWHSDHFEIVAIGFWWESLVTTYCKEFVFVDERRQKIKINSKFIYLSEWSTNRVSKSWHSLTFSVKYRFVLMCEPPYTLHILRCSTESRSEIRDRSGQ